MIMQINKVPLSGETRTKAKAKEGNSLWKAERCVSVFLCPFPLACTITEADKFQIHSQHGGDPENVSSSSSPKSGKNWRPSYGSESGGVSSLTGEGQPFWSVRPSTD